MRTSVLKITLFRLGILMAVAGIAGMAAYPLLLGEVHHILVSQPIIKTSLLTRNYIFIGCWALMPLGAMLIVLSTMREVRRL